MPPGPSRTDGHANDKSTTVSCDLDTVTAGAVRGLVRRLLADRHGVAVEDAVLVTEELVTNAYRHGSPPRSCHLTLLDQHRLRVEVTDAGAAQPVFRTPDLAGGRGLLLVDRLAAVWGVRAGEGSKTAWAEVALGDRDAGRAPHLATAARPEGDGLPHLGPVPGSLRHHGPTRPAGLGAGAAHLAPCRG